MKIWIYLNGVQNGPYELEQLPQLPVNGGTPVWHEGMADWKPAYKAPATARFFPEGKKQERAIDEAAIIDEAVKPIGQDNNMAEEAKAESEIAEETKSVEAAYVDDKQGRDTGGNMVDNAEKETEVEKVEIREAVVCDRVIAEFGLEAATADGKPEETVELSPEDLKAKYKECPAFLPWSIVLTCCCCTPTSIAAIVTGALTLRSRKRRNWTRARKLSHATEWLVIISITLGIMSLPLSVFRYML